MVSQVSYSGTPLVKKLGIKAGFKLFLYNIPEHYFELFTEFPEDIEILEEPLANTADFMHLFYNSLNDLKDTIRPFKTALKKKWSNVD